VAAWQDCAILRPNKGRQKAEDDSLDEHDAGDSPTRCPASL
jgi:hypothetical protein